MLSEEESLDDGLCWGMEISGTFSQLLLLMTLWQKMAC